MTQKSVKRRRNAQYHSLRVQVEAKDFITGRELHQKARAIMGHDWDAEMAVQRLVEQHIIIQIPGENNFVVAGSAN